MVNMVNNLPENSIFNVLAIGPHQLPLTTMGIVMGGHVRIGMEDNLYYRRGEPAESNAQLVERTVRIADGTRPGTRDACGGRANCSRFRPGDRGFQHGDRYSSR